MKCKFCGAEVNIPTFKSTKSVSCAKCIEYCNKKCEQNMKQMLSWHKEPCAFCEHNPYHKAYKYEDGKWIRKA